MSKPWVPYLWKAGIPVLGMRRVPGLRREEVAMLSGISTGSIHGWIWVPLAFVGTIFGLRIRRHFGF